LVLDEADRMLNDTTLKGDLDYIFEKLSESQTDPR